TLPPGDPPEARLAVLPILRASPFGAGATVFVGMTVGCFFALGPVYAQAQGLSQAGLGLFMALATGAAMVSQWPLGRLSDRLSRRIVASACAAAACGVLFVFLSAPTDTAITLALAALLGATLFPTQAIAAAQVNDRVERRHSVAAAGTLVLLLSTGAASGPILAGAAMDAFGARGWVLSLTAFQAAIAGLGVLRLLMRPQIGGTHRQKTRWGILQPALGAFSQGGAVQGELFERLKARRGGSRPS
ncbi:MAG: MFS transporter, partial [Oceanicaulis sp.]